MTKVEKADRFVEKGMSVTEASKRAGLKNRNSYYAWRNKNKKQAKAKGRVTVLPKRPQKEHTIVAASVKLFVFHGTAEQIAAVAKELQQ